MIIKNYAILCLSLMVSVNVVSAHTESTNDYAFGAELNLTDSDSMFSRVELNTAVYTQTISPTLDDVRVFNRNGQTVPFTLIDVYSKKETNQQFDMTIYPINNNSQANNAPSSDSYSISIEGENVTINLDRMSRTQEPYSRSYLLQVPNDVTIEQPIANFKLSFANQPENWQATANIAYSSDLRYWSQVARDVPIMALTNRDNSKLTLMDINFSSYSSYKNPHWVITLSSANPLPDLVKVIASSEQTSINNALYPINFTLQSSDAQNATYTLPSQQPIEEISIDLNRLRSVLPVSIFYKSNMKDENWIKLEDRIIRKTDNYDEPVHISFNGKLISGIKLTTINSSFEQAPELVAYRNKVDLVFNSANNAPFILAWGAAQPKSVALPSDALLSANDAIDSLPLAFIGDSVKLAGEQVLTTDQESSSSGIPQWVIWVGLIIGAGVLVLLAFKLFKEIKKEE